MDVKTARFLEVAGLLEAKNKNMGKYVPGIWDSRGLSH